jgi:hypothetical protein
MAHVRVAFYRILQTSQMLGVEQEFMVAALRMQIAVDDWFTCDTQASVKQVTGSRYDDYEIEVGRPLYYPGPLMYDKYADAAREFYTSAIGPEGRVIRVAAAASNIRMEGNVVDWGPFQVEFDAPLTDAGAW